MNYLINGIVFNTQLRTLNFQSTTIQLEAKSYELLLAFITHHKTILSRDELIALAWQGQVVSDGAINKAVSKLRRHLAQLQRNTVFIVTKPKLGYQLRFEAEPIADDTKHAQTSTLDKRYLLLPVLIMISATLYLFNLTQSDSVTKTTVLLERISAYDGLERNLSASRNAQLLFISSPTHNQPKRLILKSLTDNSEQIIPIDSQSLTFASLSPSGTSIMWVAQNNEGCNIMQYELRSDTQRPIFTCSDMQDIKLSWQADEQAIFIRARVNNASPYVIYKLMLGSKTRQQISLPLKYAQMRGDFLLAAHPKNNLIAYVRYTESNTTEIHLVDGNTFDTHAVYPTPHMVNAITWSAISNTLYLADEKKIYRLNNDTGQTELIKQLSLPIESMSVIDRDMQDRILFSQYHASSSIKSYNLGNKTITNVFNNAALNRLPRSYQDGLVFISDMGKEHTLWHYQGEKLSQLNIPFEFGFSRYHINSALQTMVFEKLGAVYEYDLNHASLKRLIGSEHQAYAANYGSDPNHIVYSSNKSGQWQLWQYNKKTSLHQKLTTHGGYSGYFYHDQLYFSKRNQAGLWTLNSGKEQMLIKDFSNINWLNWQIVNGSIYFYRKGSGVWQYHLGRQVEKLVMSEPEGFVHQYHITSDEQQLIFVQLNPLQGDIHALVLN